MPDAYKVLYQNQVPASNTTLYTVPAATSTIVRYASIVNADATTARTLKLWIGGLTDSNIWLPTLSLEAGERAEFEGVLPLETGQTIRGIASLAAKVTVMITGLEIS